MRSARVLGAALVAGSSAAACQLLLELGPSDLTMEGGAGAGDAVPPESSLPPPDSRSDEIPACDATFCDDFDDVPVPWEKWTDTQISRGAVLLDDAQATSKPNALLVRGTAVASGYSDARLLLDAGKAKRVSCTFRLLLEDVPVDAGGAKSFFADFFEVRIVPATTTNIAYYRINFSTSPTAAGVRDDVRYLDGGCDCPLRSVDSLAPLGRNTWLTAEVVVSPSIAELRIDGAVAATLPLLDVDLDAGASFVQLKLGVSHNEGQPWILRYDDVSCSY